MLKKLKKVNPRDWVVVGITIAVTIILLLLADKYLAKHPNWHTIVSNSVSIVGVSIILGCLSNRMIIADIMSTMVSAHSVCHKPIELGLSTINEFSADFKSRLKNSKSLKVVANYAGTWLNHNHCSLVSFLSKGGKIEFIFLKPDSATCVNLNEKFSEKDLANKITGSVDKIKNLSKDIAGTKRKRNKNKGTVKVFYQPHFIPYSAYIFDDELILIPSRLSSGRSKVYEYVFRKKDSELFDFYLDDVNKLIEQSGEEVE